MGLKTNSDFWFLQQRRTVFTARYELNIKYYLGKPFKPYWLRDAPTV